MKVEPLDPMRLPGTGRARGMCPVLLLGVLCCGLGCTETGSGAAKSAGPEQARMRGADPGVRPEPEPQAAPEVPGMRGVSGPELLSLVRRHPQGALVNMWASWCGSCKKELPMLMTLDAAYRDHGLGLFLVSADSPDALSAARAMLDALGISRPGYFIAGSVADFKRTVYPRWKGGIPATFLIDRSGRVRFFWNGPLLAEEMSPVIQRYLAGEAVDGEHNVAAEPPSGS